MKTVGDQDEMANFTLDPFIHSILTHFILNRLSHTIHWKSPISILGMSGYIMYIMLEKKDIILKYSSLFSQKIGFDISCKLETIYMKYQLLFSGNNISK